MEETKKTEEKTGEIDLDVLDILPSEVANNAVKDEVKMKRLLLDCFCELLSQVHEVNQRIDEQNILLSTVSAKTVASIFKEYETNVEREVNYEKAKEIREKSHEKPKNKKKLN